MFCTSLLLGSILGTLSEPDQRFFVSGAINGDDRVVTNVKGIQDHTWSGVTIRIAAPDSSSSLGFEPERRINTIDAFDLAGVKKDSILYYVPKAEAIVVTEQGSFLVRFPAWTFNKDGKTYRQAGLNRAKLIEVCRQLKQTQLAEDLTASKDGFLFSQALNIRHFVEVDVSSKDSGAEELQFVPQKAVAGTPDMLLDGDVLVLCSLPNVGDIDRTKLFSVDEANRQRSRIMSTDWTFTGSVAAGKSDSTTKLLSDPKSVVYLGATKGTALGKEWIASSITDHKRRLEQLLESKEHYEPLSKLVELEQTQSGLSDLSEPPYNTDTMRAILNIPPVRRSAWSSGSVVRYAKEPNSTGIGLLFSLVGTPAQVVSTLYPLGTLAGEKPKDTSKQESFAVVHMNSRSWPQFLWGISVIKKIPLLFWDNEVKSPLVISQLAKRAYVVQSDGAAFNESRVDSIGLTLGSPIPTFPKANPWRSTENTMFVVLGDTQQ